MFMDNELNKIILQLKDLLPELKTKFGVSSLELFGSYVKNQQTKDSDLDLLVTFSYTPTLLEFIKLKNYISDKLNMKIDLVMKDSLKERIQFSIDKECISI